MEDWYTHWRAHRADLRTSSRAPVISSGNDFSACRLSAPGLDGELLSVPSGAGGVGGDIHFITVNESQTLVTVLVVDISGHGAEVRDLSEGLEETMRTLIDEPDNGLLLKDLNKAMLQRGIRGRYATAVVGSYSVPDRTWSYAYAGHPYMLHGVAGSWKQLEAQAGRTLPAGIMHEVPYLQTSIDLVSGEWLLLYSDGATDMRLANGGRLGIDGLVDLAATAAADSDDTTHAVFSQLVGELVTVNGSDNFDDDLSLILLRCSG